MKKIILTMCLSFSTLLFGLYNVGQTVSISDQNIEFNVFDQNQNDITDISIFYVDGLEILGNQIIHEQIGTHSVYAEFSVNNQ